MKLSYPTFPWGTPPFWIQVGGMLGNISLGGYGEVEQGLCLLKTMELRYLQQSDRLTGLLWVITIPIFYSVQLSFHEPINQGRKFIGSTLIWSSFLSQALESLETEPQKDHCNSDYCKSVAKWSSFWHFGRWFGFFGVQVCDRLISFIADLQPIWYSIDHKSRCHLCLVSRSTISVP